MDFSSDDIILAVSSPPGRSARGLVRASGESVFALFERLFEMENPGVRARGIHRARLRLWDDLSIACLALIFPGPRSYTGDDTVELILPGNPVLLERVIDWLIEQARRQSLFARRAEPGEYTFRAFLNGRISLTEAEGVNATIAARSDAELRAATLLRSGTLGELGKALADELAGALVLVEAGIDFTDQEDVIAIAPADLLQRLQPIASRLSNHLARARPFEELGAIPWVVIAGPPNAGKSTLYNVLLGRERAVVSPVAGTTRDVLAEPLSLEMDDGMRREVLLIDMAGLDASDESFINVEMQQAAARALERAELILCCNSVDQMASTEFAAAVDAEEREMAILTKFDLFPNRAKSDSAGAGSIAIAVSAVTGSGLDDLRGAIASRLADRAVSLAADAFALLPRQEAALRSALAHIEEAIDLLGPQRCDRALAGPEIIASLLRLALDDLSGLAGAVTPEDILGRIFAGFCIGK